MGWPFANLDNDTNSFLFTLFYNLFCFSVVLVSFGWLRKKRGDLERSDSTSPQQETGDALNASLSKRRSRNEQMHSNAQNFQSRFSSLPGVPDSNQDFGTALLRKKSLNLAYESKDDSEFGDDRSSQNAKDPRKYTFGKRERFQSSKINYDFIRNTINMDKKKRE